MVHCKNSEAHSIAVITIAVTIATVTVVTAMEHILYPYDRYNEKQNRTIDTKQL